MQNIAGEDIVGVLCCHHGRWLTKHRSSSVANLIHTCHGVLVLLAKAHPLNGLHFLVDSSWCFITICTQWKEMVQQLGIVTEAAQYKVRQCFGTDSVQALFIYLFVQSIHIL